MASDVGAIKPTGSLGFAKKDMSPGFLSGNKNEAKRDGASGSLRSAEDNAISKAPEKSVDNLAGARENEEKAGGLYTGGGRSRGKEGGKFSDKFKGKGKGFLKKKGPAGLIIGLIFGVGGLVGGAQLLQPFSLVEQFRETFNSMQVSASTRSNKLFRLQMESGRVKDPIRGTIFGRKFKISDKQKSKLKQNGIEYDEEFEVNGVKRKVLKFDDGTGEIKIVTADAKTAKALGEINGVDAASGKAYSKTAISFDEIYSTNSDFHQKYNSGSLTWRGKIANWFGTRVNAFLNRNRLDRNSFDDYQNKKAAKNNDGMSVVEETLKKKTETINNEGEKVRETEEAKDNDGKTILDKDGDPVMKDSGESSSSDSGKITRGDTDGLGKKMDNIKNKFASSANLVCGVSNAVGAVMLTVSAAEALQIINLVTAYFETVDKVKAGDGDNAPINELATTLNEEKTSTNKVLKSMTEVSDGEYAADIEEVTTKKSAMQSEGIAALYSYSKVDQNNASVRSFNLTSSIKNVMGGVAGGMAAFQTCTIAKLTAAVLDVGKGVIDLGKCVLGLVFSETVVGAAVAVEGCAELVADIGWKIAKGAVIGLAIAGVFSVLAPVLTNAWTRDLVTNIGGEDLGNALASGGNMYLGGAHKANGGSPATRSEYESYAVAQRQVMEDYARYERESLSPLDMTSKYTFMGTLMNKLSGFVTTSSLMGVLKFGSSVISNSVMSLSPVATAYDIANVLPDEEEYKDTCPYLASVGVVGDAYCNPYMITDISTINEDPVDVINKITTDYDGFTDDTTDDGNVKIKGNSDLAKYIRYCNNRNSMFGLADYNILADINSPTSSNTGNNYVDAAVDGAIGSVFLIGDGIDVVENAKAMSNVGYISGESCVAGNNVSNVSAAPNWDKAKYYQRFIEDQSLAESMGVIDKSAVTAYLEEYYEENPLDNSYEGVLARYSGLDKETVSDVIYIANYYNFVNNYDASDRYAFGTPKIDKSHEILFDDDNVVAEDTHGILLNEISFADVRNRSFAV